MSDLKEIFSYISLENISQISSIILAIASIYILLLTHWIKRIRVINITKFKDTIKGFGHSVKIENTSLNDIYISKIYLVDNGKYIILFKDENLDSLKKLSYKEFTLYHNKLGVEKEDRSIFLSKKAYCLIGIFRNGKEIFIKSKKHSNFIDKILASIKIVVLGYNWSGSVKSVLYNFVLKCIYLYAVVRKDDYLKHRIKENSFFLSRALEKVSMEQTVCNNQIVHQSTLYMIDIPILELQILLGKTNKKNLYNSWGLLNKKNICEIDLKIEIDLSKDRSIEEQNKSIEKQINKYMLENYSGLEYQIYKASVRHVFY
ncbi:MULTISPECIES: hypothetical protein [Francisella]|uniref:Uncharacterized protein n=1 Tax=Francisella opportunistica TaxID=2016517 RepID=A0A345JRY4_9GAMM|nr:MULTISPECIES: hypothetical protein [Francisella]APC91838.1 hypothetical protein BBG19_1104 [Francisella sp. MA067296]AXH30080.1 hypothetical protein CGC43_05540 [Francisella opportunistica]AXH31724.1 hypothetical protein CGC44_05530 [Francisella opportunistica]AXH33370.1 hypothetical protein CGC45_05540 [Francisella opportunistica]